MGSYHSELKVVLVVLTIMHALAFCGQTAAIARKELQEFQEVSRAHHTTRAAPPRASAARTHNNQSASAGAIWSTLADAHCIACAIIC